MTTYNRRSVRIAERAAAARRKPTEDADEDEHREERKARKPRRKRIRKITSSEWMGTRASRLSDNELDEWATEYPEEYYEWRNSQRDEDNDVDAADYLGIPYEMRRPSAVPRIHYEPVHVDPVTGFLDGFRSAALSRLTREPERRGLSADDLEKYAPTKNAGFSCGKACAVCLEEPAHGSAVRELPCSHVYHRACIDRWFDLSNCCPTCRKPVRPDDHTPIIPSRDQLRPDLDSWGAYVRLVSRINAPLTTA